eukprot:NODE_672_length_5352_cov_0.334856.p3 type:complete len:218 gc:universal NODE_672_length_5352_cov_0.334856:284-937(+)
MRRGVGIAGLAKQQATRARYAEQGNKLQQQEKEELEKLLEELKLQLEAFSNEHFTAITKNPELREKLTILCNKFDVNILSKKNIFHSVLGNFYLQLNVLFIQILKEHQIMEKNEIAELLASRTKQDITVKDLDQCLESLKPLGQINIISINNKEYVSNVQVEHAQLLTRKSWTEEEIKFTLNLNDLIAKTYFDELLRIGIGWLDEPENRIYIGSTKF